MRPGLHALLAVLLGGCGARSGLADDDDDIVGHDAGLPDAADGLDADVPDAAQPLGCDGRPLPHPGVAVDVPIPPRMYGLSVLIPSPLGVLVVGGQPALGEDATQMVFLDLSTRAAQELPVEGDDVRLPGGTGVAVYVPDDDSVVVIGGSGAAGVPTDQVFSFNGEGDPSGLRQVRAHLLPDFPGGPVQGLGAVWDPAHHRVIVHGGRGLPDEPSDTRTTWALELGDDPGWHELVAATDSPPPGTRAMGYDPVRSRAIEITDDDDGAGLAVFALSLDDAAETWTRLGEIDFSPSTSGELLWDDASCGFHLLSARRTRCTLEHWILVVDGESATAVFRGEPLLDPTHFLASALFVAARSELVLTASQDCAAEGTPNVVAAELALER